MLKTLYQDIPSTVTEGILMVEDISGMQTHTSLTP